MNKDENSKCAEHGGVDKDKRIDYEPKFEEDEGETQRCYPN